MESLYLYPWPRFLNTLKHPLTLGASPFKSKLRTPSSVQVWVLFPCLLKVFSFSDRWNLKLNCHEIMPWFPFPTPPFSVSEPGVLICCPINSDRTMSVFADWKSPTYQLCYTLWLLSGNKKLPPPWNVCTWGTSIPSNCLVNLPGSVSGYHLTSQALLWEQVSPSHFFNVYIK